MGKNAHVPQWTESFEQVKCFSKNKTEAVIEKKEKGEKALCWNNNKENVAVHDFSFMDSWRH